MLTIFNKIKENLVGDISNTCSSFFLSFVDLHPNIMIVLYLLDRASL